MPRVHEVAKELGVSSREVLDRLEVMGTPVSSHASSIDDATAADLRSQFGPIEDDGEALTAVDESVVDELDRDPSESVPPTAPPPRPKRKKKRGVLSHVAEIPVLIVFAFAIAIIIKTFLVQAFFIPSGSMIPTLRVGDRVLVEKVTYLLHGPRRGDVVVFARSVFGEPPDLPWHQDARNFLRELLGMQTAGGEQDYIKRVVAVGGDSIRYTGDPRRLFIDGRVLDEPYIKDGADRTSSTITAGDCKRLEMERSEDGCVVPAGMVFVMGDNRANSQDSRSIGPVEEDKIVGRAWLIIWPPSDFAAL